MDKLYKDTAGNVYAYNDIQTPKTGLIKMTTAEVDAHLAPEPPTIVDPKLVGIEFQGVMCSATKEDMWGLSSVASWIEGGKSTAFEFDNGNVLVLTPENYHAFYDVWASFRASFFNKVE